MTEAIGALLRKARVKRSMSLRSLASAVGVSSSLISQVETGKTQPSVSTLYALTNYLGLSIDDLLDNSPPAQDKGPRGRELTVSEQFPTSSPIQRADDNPCLEMDNGVRWERLAIGVGGPAEPILAIYSPGASSSIEGKLMRHSGLEYAYIIEGELTLQLDFDTYVLRPGDSLQFDSIRPHIYANHGATPAKGVWFVVGRKEQTESMPDVMQAPKRAHRRNESEIASHLDVLVEMDKFTSGTPRRLR